MKLPLTNDITINRNEVILCVVPLVLLAIGILLIEL